MEPAGDPSARMAGVEEMMEGWYTDPYGRHEARWMSQGTPTSLIRDQEVEGRDPWASDEPFHVTPVRIKGHPRYDGTDLLRADDAKTPIVLEDTRNTSRLDRLYRRALRRQWIALHPLKAALGYTAVFMFGSLMIAIVCGGDWSYIVLGAVCSVVTGLALLAQAFWRWVRRVRRVDQVWKGGVHGRS